MDSQKQQTSTEACQAQPENISDWLDELIYNSQPTASAVAQPTPVVTQLPQAWPQTAPEMTPAWPQTAPEMTPAWPQTVPEMANNYTPLDLEPILEIIREIRADVKTLLTGDERSTDVPNHMCTVCKTTREIFCCECNECNTYTVCGKCLVGFRESRRCPKPECQGALKRKIAIPI